MRILIAPDKFKGSLTAMEAAAAIASGIRQSGLQAELEEFPMADGGEGTATLLTWHCKGRFIETTVHDPLFRPVRAGYGLDADGHTAFIEMAAASGIQLLRPEDLHTAETTTYGTGELIMHAVNAGCRSVILGIGGSATTDGGTGMAAALGYRFLNGKGEVLHPSGKNLLHIQQIDGSRLKIDLQEVSIRVAADVSNPLYGANGAAFVYGPQKGASPHEVVMLDRGLRHLAGTVENKYDCSCSQVPGAGAAGGLGFGLMVFAHATLEPGIGLVMDITGFREHLEQSDYLVTGEGKLDSQTWNGKTADGLCRCALSKKIPVLVLAGVVDPSAFRSQPQGIIYTGQCWNGIEPVAEAMKHARERLEQAACKMAMAKFL